MNGREWVGTTAELSHLTGDSPERVFARLRAYRSDLAGQDIVVVPVETRSGWRWLAVDGSRLGPTRKDARPGGFTRARRASTALLSSVTY